MIYQYIDVGDRYLVDWLFIKERMTRNNYFFDVSVQLGKLFYPRVTFTRRPFFSDMYFEKKKDGFRYQVKRESKGLGKTRLKYIVKSCNLFTFIPNDNSIIFEQQLQGWNRTMS